MKALTKIILCNIFMPTTFVDVFTSTVKGYSVANLLPRFSLNNQ